MSEKLSQPDEKLEAVFREMREARSQPMEKLYREPMGCIRFSRLMQIAQGEIMATKEEAGHLSGCVRCQQVAGKARNYLASADLKSGERKALKPMFDRLLEGFRQVRGWAETATDYRCSRIPCRFVPADAGAYVMGAITKTYECNLMYLLDELGVSNDFEAFTLVCETGRGTTVGATLIPRESGRGVDIPIEVTLYLSVVEPSPRRSKRSNALPRSLVLRLKPYAGETSTPKKLFSEIGDPAKFAGNLEIRIREAVLGTEEC